MRVVTAMQLRNEVHQMEKNTDDVLTIEELANYLKISKSTLYKLVREGKIPSQKIGRHWRFLKDGIDHWLDETRIHDSHSHSES